MTSKVYRHKAMALDELLGRVDPDGRVYATERKVDHYVGRVELDTGKVYAAREGPDEYVGRVELDTGKVYRSKFGPDDYLGRVTDDGEFRVHKPIAPDTYIGQLTAMPGYGHGGAAFLLLAWPAWEKSKPARPDQAK
jgi:hypothetical protein